MKTEKRNASFVLGIVSILTSFLFPLASLVCAIVGLSIPKNESRRSTEIALNVIGLVLGLFGWVVWTLYFLGI